MAYDLDIHLPDSFSNEDENLIRVSKRNRFNMLSQIQAVLCFGQINSKNCENMVNF